MGWVRLFGVMRWVADVMRSHVDLNVYLLKASLDSKSRTVRRVAQLQRAENHEEAVSAQPLEVQMTEGRASLSRIVIFDPACSL